jgi:tRNA-2-methylthio-N6-dimethylallyladenosine synthase
VRETREQRRVAGEKTIVAVTGCVAQAEGAEIARRAPVVDLVVGPQSYHELPALLRQVERDTGPLVHTEFNETDKFAGGLDGLKSTVRRTSPASFLTVQEGCDKFCTFCVVPYTRGAEFSRPVERVVAEAHRLVDVGVREITLLGQNVNAYHGEDADGRPTSLARLLERLSEVPRLERLRYTTSHPRDMTPDLIAAHRDLPKLMPYLHLPFQAGADRILAAMNRKHTAVEYRETVGRIRDARPDIALSTDIIVGFPGETDAEFEATLDMVRAVGFAQAYSFKYSPRPGTPASTIDGQVPEHVKSARLLRLQSLLASAQQSFNRSCVGRSLPVLFDKIGRHSGQIVGRSPYLQAVHVEGDTRLLGHILDVEIVGSGPNSLSGIAKLAGVPA